MKKISLALTAHNEESNIADCIQSCNGLVDEIVDIESAKSKSLMVILNEVKNLPSGNERKACSEILRM